MTSLAICLKTCPAHWHAFKVPIQDLCEAIHLRAHIHNVERANLIKINTEVIIMIKKIRAYVFNDIPGARAGKGTTLR